MTGGFASAKRTARLDDLFQRLTNDELHPQSDATVMLLRAVHVHDVRMTQAGKASALVERPHVGVRSTEPVLAEELERDVPMQTGVPRAVNIRG